MPITNITLNPELGSIATGEMNKAAAPGFDEKLKAFLGEANEKMLDAEKASAAFAAGETNNIHETMLSTEQAMVTFKLVATIRNRVLEAYNEIMRMGV